MDMDWLSQRLSKDSGKLKSILRHMVKQNELLVRFRSNLQQLADIIGDYYYEDLFEELESEFQIMVKEGDRIELAEFFVEKPKSKPPVRANRGSPDPLTMGLSSIELDAFTNNDNNTDDDSVDNQSYYRRKANEAAPEPQELACTWPDCQEVFYWRRDLNSHLMRHSRDELVACDWPGCDHQGKRKYMKKHVACVHGDRPQVRVKKFECHWPGCDRRFTFNHELTRHLAIHRNEKKYACDQPNCKFRTAFASSLKSHKYRIHFTSDRYKCDWPGCDSTFFFKHQWKMHTLDHTGEKPELCSWPGCNRSYKDKWSRDKHFKRHSMNEEELAVERRKKRESEKRRLMRRKLEAKRKAAQEAAQEAFQEMAPS